MAAGTSDRWPTTTNYKRVCFEGYSRPQGLEEYHWGGGLESRWGIALIGMPADQGAIVYCIFMAVAALNQVLPAFAHTSGECVFRRLEELLVVVSGAWQGHERQ